MSARDSAGPAGPGTNGAGGLANGGIGGGFGGGAYGGGGGVGAGGGINGGYNNRTGLTTGNMMYGGKAQGRPGGMAQNPGAWGMRPGPSVSQSPLNRPTRPGFLGNPVPVSMPGVNPPVSPPYDLPFIYDQPIGPPMPPSSISGPWPGQGTIPGNPGSTYYQNNQGNPYGQYAPPNSIQGPDGFYSNSLPSGKGDYAGPSNQSVGGKGDYGGGNFGYGGNWRR